MRAKKRGPAPRPAPNLLLEGIQSKFYRKTAITRRGRACVVNGPVLCVVASYKESRHKRHGKKFGNISLDHLKQLMQFSDLLDQEHIAVPALLLGKPDKWKTVADNLIPWAPHYDEPMLRQIEGLLHAFGLMHEVKAAAKPDDSHQAMIETYYTDEEISFPRVFTAMLTENHPSTADILAGSITPLRRVFFVKQRHAIDARRRLIWRGRCDGLRSA
jgi:hypothetical protein